MGHRHSKNVKTASNPLQEMQIKQKQKSRKKREKMKQDEYIKKLRDKVSKDTKNKINIEQQQQQQQQQEKLIDLKNIDYNQIALTTLREQISSDISSFLSNQLLLSVQFFGNFELEKQVSMQHFMKKEYELNQKLENHSVILLNAIDDAVDKRIQFQAKHGPEKNISSPLQLQTLYVIYESVQVYDPNYDHIQPVCRVDIDASNFVGEDKVSKGYVRLKLRDNNKNNIKIKNSQYNYTMKKNLDNYQSTSSIDSVYESDSFTDSSTLKLHQQKQQQINLNHQNHEKNNNLNQETSDIATSSYVSSSETDYEYITNLNTHKPLDINLLEKSQQQKMAISSSILPESCITTMQLEIDDDDEDDDDNYSDCEFENDSKFKVKYINSKNFFSYFIELLKDNLANNLNITENELNLATWKNSSIFTKKYEIIPAIYIQNWPGCAIEWKIRKRKKYRNPVNGKLIQWPTPEMIKEIIDYGCYVIPQGYIHKTDYNPYRELEWKIQFPKAEKYLESCLTSTQIKILMICKTLIKTFIEQNKDKYGTFMFTIEHLRMHLFWECEKNFLAWNDEYLGEILIRFLKSFIKCLSNKSLPDYFIRDRNLFEYIPDRYKNDLLIILSQIVENPVMHIIKTLKNLNQLEQFYPKFNYNKLYTCIVTDNLLKFIKQIRCCVKSSEILEAIEENNNSNNNDGDTEIVSDDENPDIINNESEGLIAYYNKKEKLDETKRRRTKKLKFKEVQRLKRKMEREMKSRPSEDSIDLKFIVPEQLSKIQRHMNKDSENIRPLLDRMRCVLIVEMFINHFIQMSKSMFNLKSYDQCKIYLNQAERLTQILIDYDYSHYAEKYINDIQQIRNAIIEDNNKILLSEIQDEVPKLPVRTSLQPIESFRKKSNISNVQRHSSRLKFIEPRPFQIDDDITDHTPSPTPSSRSRTNSVKFSFKVKADIHRLPSQTTSNSDRPTSGILKSNSKNKNDFNFDGVKVELRNNELNRDKIKTKSITLVRENDDDDDEESTEL